jgi:hypothetical protein
MHIHLHMLYVMYMYPTPENETILVAIYIVLGHLVFYPYFTLCTLKILLGDITM